VVKRRTLQEEENRRLELLKEGSLQEQVEPVDHRVSAYRGWLVQAFHARRNRELRFPDLIGAVDHRRDRWHEIPRSQDSALRRFRSRREHGETAKSRVATGPMETVWSITRGINTSVLGVPNYKGSASRVAISRSIDH
jgi:hypothetical protein